MALHAAPTNAAGSVQSVAAARREGSQLARQRLRVLDEQRSSSVSRLSLAEQLRMREQQAVLDAARQQAARWRQRRSACRRASTAPTRRCGRAEGCA